MIFRELLIKGFQRHPNLKIQFSPGITTIIGPTDSGKSAILRALRWLGLNRPPKGDYINHESEYTSITANVDGLLVTRVKSRKTTNIYKVDGRKLSAIGRDVPEEVKDILRLGPLNFQGQHDHSLWFGESAPEVSRQLNQIVDLGVIDETLTKLASTLRKAKIEQDVVTGQYDEACEEKESLKGCREAEGGLVALEHQDRKIEEAEKEIGTLARLVQNAVEYRQEAKRLRKRLGGDKLDLGPVEEITQAIDRAQQQITRVGELVEVARDSLRDAERYTTEMDQAKKRLTVEMGKQCVLCGSKLGNQR